jgi:hypothetical protein
LVRGDRLHSHIEVGACGEGCSSEILAPSKLAASPSLTRKKLLTKFGICSRNNARCETQEDATMTQTITNNNADYWTKLREAHRDIHKLIEAECAAAFAIPRGTEVYDYWDGSTQNDDHIHRQYDRMQAKADANPLLARLRRSLSDGEINNRYI